MVLALAGIVIRYGLRQITSLLHWELGLLVVVSLLMLLVSRVLTYTWSLDRKAFLQSEWLNLGILSVWILGLPLVAIINTGEAATQGSQTWPIVQFSEVLVLIRAAAELVGLIRRLTSGGMNPALLLVGSFALLITVGTLLLMLPRARAVDPSEPLQSGAPLLTALFTATSASCVTGLVVVPTGTYWTRFGQVIIMALFQIGGLGIMTFGAFFAIAAGKGMRLRETATLHGLLESQQLGDVRRLVATILAFTAMAEVTGALLMMGLWREQPPGEMLFQAAFHSVSAFCNAGFSLTDNSLVGLETRFEVWAVIPALIIFGGLGFSTWYNVSNVIYSSVATPRLSPLLDLPRGKTRFTLTAKLVTTTTIMLLLVGMVSYLLLESVFPVGPEPFTKRLANAWFQSVTFRTAGFNTVEIGELQPGTKLFGVLLMFIGASPGSTGGGIKTTSFAVMVLTLLAMLRGRQSTEAVGRTISATQVNRALTIISLGGMTVMVSTLLLVIFENNESRFLDHVFEATSAFATVGLSTGITSQLTSPSQLVIIATMLIGRVGPLTLLIALAGRRRQAIYEYPEETISLG